MPQLFVVKRDGAVVPFMESRIINAVSKAITATTNVEDKDLAVKVADAVCKDIGSKEIDQISVEEIQDLVEKQLIAENKSDIAKSYILYRQKRNDVRSMNSSIFKAISKYMTTDSSDMDDKRENANINAEASMGSMLKIGGAATKQYNLSKLMSPKYAQMHKDGKIHIHDLDFYGLCPNCLYIPADKLLKRGFCTGHGSLRPPKSIGTAVTQIAIMIQSDQNDMFQ